MPACTINDNVMTVQGSTPRVKRIPPGVRHLIIRRAQNIKEIPKLPASLKTIYVYECCSLTSIPAIPRNVSVVYLTDLPSLVSMGSMPGKQEWEADADTRAITARCALLKFTPILRDLVRIIEDYLAGFTWTEIETTTFCTSSISARAQLPPSIFSPNFSRGDSILYPIEID